MPPSSAKRVAALAVLRYRADRARVRAEVASVLRGRGDGTDMLAALVGKGLLTHGQADELRDILQEQASRSRTPRPDRALRSPLSNVPAAIPLATAPRSLGGCRILRRLGEGGMGAVYLGYHEEQRRQVAVKVLAEELTANQVCVECFYREARTSTQLDHPAIVHGIAVGRDEATGLHYLVREFIDGPSGHVLLDRLGRLPVGDAVHIALQVALALEYLHVRNLVHRDIKPDNILLDRSGMAKLTDLGLVKRIGEGSTHTALRHGFGTSYYMPYEQALDARRVDGRSDIYALGATLYHLLTGQVPFGGENHLEIIQKKDLGLFIPASALNPDVPPELDAILAKMLARRPVDRYPTAGALSADLAKSRLAARVPTFSEIDWSRDQRLERAGGKASNQPTSLDSHRSPPLATNGRGKSTIWYLRYQDPTGRWCKTKATTRELMRRLSSGRMPAHVQASAQPRGQFRPLASYPEFRESAALTQLANRPAAAPPPVLTPPEVVAVRRVEAPGNWYIWVRVVLALACLVALGTAVYVLSS
jgi:serine/threonine-protein kinase